jgi:RecB family exonuclease
MKIRREFLDWKQPALAAAADVLLRRFGKNGALDLSNVVVVVPGGRAGRRLLELLVAKASESRLTLTPPAIVTPDSFPELLYQAKWPFADTLTQQLAWMATLQDGSAESLKEFLPYPPDRIDIPRWLAIAEGLRRLHTELAADGLDCAKVVDDGKNVAGFNESARWKVLAAVQRRYLDRLDALKLWDVQTARLVAIKQREIATDKEIVLLGTVDLNRTQRRMLDQVASHVTALVVAPPAMAARFDEHGCLIPSQWTEAELPLTDEQIDRVDGPADQAEALTRWLDSLGGRYRADEITIGLPDEKIVPQIERQLSQCDLSGRWAIGKEVSASAPYRLLQVAADYAGRQRFRDLAALVRHPDIYEYVSSQGASADFLAALDKFESEKFPAHLERERLEKDAEAADVLAIYSAVEKLIAPLSAKPRPLAEWTEPLRAILQTIYGAKPLDRLVTADRYLLESLELISRALDAVGQLPQPLQPKVDVRQACRIVLAEVAGETIPPPVGDEQIELLGWLDLPLDDAPAVFLTTFNDGFVPSTTSTDAFLPNTLREALGLMHNDRRLARDTYALSLLIASRQELKVIVAKRDSQSNPLLPSRLLFLTDTEKAVARGRRFFGELPPQPPRRNLLAPTSGAATKSKIVRPLPKKLAKPITSLSVTRFRDYLACPYRFYLKHVLRLEAIEDDAAELDGAAFGDLVHRVLAGFGRSEQADAKEARTTSDWTKVAGYLDHKLDEVAAARFGKKQARPAVLVQVEQLRLRLRAFAQWQAQRSGDGWRIVFSEDADNQKKLSCNWPVDNRPFTLEGRIDRIDYHEGLGRLAVLDYKTADSGDDPTKTHLKADKWIDLQLPLYRHLLSAATPKAIAVEEVEVDLGYIVLPVDVKGVGLKRGEWDDAMLASADETARSVVRLIWDEQFGPLTSPPPDFCDDLAVICQDHSLSGGTCMDGEAA